MNQLSPVSTEPRECQDCYKCVRECPVKAIRVVSGHASVVPELCVFCGHCVLVCPSGAKRSRADAAFVRQLLRRLDRVFVSLAPSWVTEFPGLSPERLVAALRRLGFAGVSETALGAEEVSAHVRQRLAAPGAGVLLSSACPAVVESVRKYRPHHAAAITALLSPLLAHARLLRGALGEDIGVVFVGPCIAKKVEADRHPELLDAALTFEELREWLAEAEVDPALVEPGPDDRFVPERAHEGALYPVEGGMIAATERGCAVDDARFMAFSGLRAIGAALDGLETARGGGPLFLELLACEGGCVNGPKTRRDQGTALKRLRVLETAPRREAARVQPLRRITAEYPASPPAAAPPPEAAIREAMRSVGKRHAEDELNCGGCGYDSCREFARALVDGRAERTMCVTYMRQLAQKKANALLQKMPAAVVIVDESLRVVECNPTFSRFFPPPEAEGGPGACEGRPLRELMPFHGLFASVLANGRDLLDRDIRHGQRVLRGAVFSIEPHALVGGIFEDVTQPAVRKEQIIRRTQEVIQKNLQTVQQIAYLIGENAAESEIALNSIVESFAPSGERTER